MKRRGLPAQLPTRPATWEDVGKAQALSGRLYRDDPIPERCTALVMFFLHVTVRATSDEGKRFFTLVPVSEFFAAYKEALAELDTLRDEQPEAAAVAGIGEVCLLFHHDDPGQMAELAEYLEQFNVELKGLQ